MRQLALQLEVVPRLFSKAANDLKFKPFRRSVELRSTHIQVLIDEIQAEDRQRLLEPRSLPKVLRGYQRRPRPQTAIISYAAQRAYERRMRGETIDVDAITREFFAGHERKLARIARRLGCT